MRSRLLDINNIACCHVKCFPSAFTVKLGKKFIEKTFEWFINSSNCFLFHEINSDRKIIGYCGGFISQYEGDGSTSNMMRYAMKEAFAGVIKQPWLLFHKEIRAFYPLILKNILRKIFPSKIKKEAQQIKIEKKAGLVVIGILPECRGKGIFEKLMNEFEKQALLNNIHSLSLSVRSNNIRAINAYKKAGWHVIKENTGATYMEKKIA